MRLAIRDFPIDDWQPGAMDVEAARLLRDVLPEYMGRDGMDDKTRKRRLVKRTQIVFCAALLTSVARQMRSRKVERFADLPERHRDKAKRKAEDTLARIATGDLTIEQILED